MSKRALKSVLLATAAFAVVLAPAGAASAESVAFDDASGDVWEDVYDQETQTQTYLEAGSKLNVDVVSTTVRHGRKIIVTTTYAELKKQEVRFATFDRMRFDDGPKVRVIADTFQRWGGTSLIVKDGGSGEPIRCAGLDHTIDYAENTVVLSVPRACVGNPTWVEVNSTGYGMETLDDGEHYYFENAMNPGHNDRGWTERVSKG